MNDKLVKYINKAREQRVYNEAKEEDELDTLVEADEEANKDSGEGDDKVTETLTGTVKRVFPFNANSESAADSVAVVYVSSSHTLKVRGRTIVVPAKSFIPVMLSGKASGSVDLRYNEDKLQFEVVNSSKDEKESEGEGEE